ncbi:unnamed protein product [Calypogeia fissa]
MVKSASESHRTSLTIHCSAPKWASFSLVSEFNKLRIPAALTGASLKVKLPKCAVFKLSFAVRYSSDCGSSNSTIRKTLKLFGLLETRKVGLKLRWCFRMLKEKTLRNIADSDAGGGADSRRDMQQRRKLVAPQHAEQEKSQRQGFSRDWCLPSSVFTNDKKIRWSTASQVGVLLFALTLPSQLGITPAMCSAALTASVGFALVLNFFGLENNKLSTELGKLWDKAAIFGGVIVPPQEPVWSVIVENFRWSKKKISLRMLIGSAALFMIILSFQLSPSNLPTWRHHACPILFEGNS